MLPVGVADSTSWSLVKVPPTIDTVAESCVLTPSGSLMVTLGESVVGDACSSVQDAFVRPLKVGGVSIVKVSVCAVLKLNDGPPSLSTQVMVRVPFAPPLVGSPAVECQVTESSTV